MRKKRILTHKEVVSRGGLATLHKYGRSHFATLGKKGYLGKLKKYGPNYFKMIRQKGIEARKKRMEERSSVQAVADILLGK